MRKASVINKASAFFLGVVISAGGSAFGQSTLIPGGIPAVPTITGETYVSNRVTVTWDGPSGYYQLYQLTNFNMPGQPVGSPYNLLRTATITNPPSPVFWRVAGTISPFAGSRYCTECHAGVLNSVIHSAHAAAFTNAQFVALGGQTNSSCWVCHTVGYGAPTGFGTNPPTPQLANVQCENCHGAAANHATNPSDVTAVPRVELAATMCGGCHNNQLVPAQVSAQHPPTYEEWSSTPHQTFDVVCAKCHDPHPLITSNLLYGATCGQCHTTAYQQWSTTLHKTFDVACQKCHDPHLLITTNLLSGATCGQCHPRAYQEWSAAPHSTYDVVCQRCHDPHLFITTNLLSGATCGECHRRVYREWSATPHHTFDVVCQNCHNPHLAVVNTNLLSGTACGECHTPIYQQWSATPHATVTPEVQADFLGPQGPTVYIPNCGKCHSGTVREAYLENEALPDGPTACAVAVACPTCHDPHEQHVYTNAITGSIYTNQVLNPLSSLQDYHTAGDWTTNYNSDVNICGQCHNDRGASYTDTRRPPHHSVQYNILLGTAGVLDPQNPGASHFQPAEHGFIPTQCVGCHMQPSPPVEAGHQFVVGTNYQFCVGCHGSATAASNLVVFVQGAILTNGFNGILDVRNLLDEWALTKAPAILGTTNYGVLAWEYTTPGTLSPPGQGPTEADQAKIPLNIKIARSNLYLVYYDGSLGVHNGPYAVDLLNVALACVRTELGVKR